MDVDQSQGADCTATVEMSSRAHGEVEARLDQWLASHRGSRHFASIRRMRQQTEVLAAWERETANNNYGRQFEGCFNYEVWHKVRVADVTLVFHGHRESMQLQCESGRRQCRESSYCVLRDVSNARLLWEFEAVEETSDSTHAGRRPAVDLGAMVALILRAGCPMLTAPEVVSFLACLAGERVVEFFHWQLLDELEAEVSGERALMVWGSMTAPHRGSLQQVAGSLKRKRSTAAHSPRNTRQCTLGGASNQPGTTCVLGKRELNEAPCPAHASQPSKRMWHSGTCDTHTAVKSA